MKPIVTVAGQAYPLGRNNVDTDVILPGRFLKTITRTGLGAGAFETIKAEAGNVFDNPAYAGAPILVSGENFGCGSSREHAVWALLDMGISVVIAESFSDIFSGNAFKNGLLTISLPPDAVADVLEHAKRLSMTIDLPTQTIKLASGREISFEIDAFRKDCLLGGLDEIGLTLNDETLITEFENRSRKSRPWVAVSAV